MNDDIVYLVRKRIIANALGSLLRAGVSRVAKAGRAFGVGAKAGFAKAKTGTPAVFGRLARQTVAKSRGAAVMGARVGRAAGTMAANPKTALGIGAGAAGLGLGTAGVAIAGSSNRQLKKRF